MASEYSVRRFGRRYGDTRRCVDSPTRLRNGAGGERRSSDWNRRATRSRIDGPETLNDNVVMSDRIELTCPCCTTKLVVDAKSGEILAEERPKKDLAKSFDDAMTNVRSGAQKRDEAFSKAADRTRNLDDLLNKKFEEARRKAKDDKSRPFNPLDAD